MVLGIYGAGATAQELYEMIQSMGTEWNQIVFMDDTQPAGTFLGCKRVPFVQFARDYSYTDAKIVIAVGEPSVRAKMYACVKEHGYQLASIIHPTCILSKSAKVSDGCIVKMHTVISSNAYLAENVYVQSYAVIGHDVVIGQNSMLSGGSFIAGHCTLGENNFLGVHSCIREGVVIGDRVIVAMMAAVMKDIGNDCTVSGNPARVIKPNQMHSVFKGA